jgi:hypothetical protein
LSELSYKKLAACGTVTFIALVEVRPGDQLLDRIWVVFCTILTAWSKMT